VACRVAAETQRLWVPAPHTHGAAYLLQLIRAAAKVEELSSKTAQIRLERNSGWNLCKEEADSRSRSRKTQLEWSRMNWNLGILRKRNGFVTNIQPTQIRRLHSNQRTTKGKRQAN
jgi:hypothetical protein